MIDDRSSNWQSRFSRRDRERIADRFASAYVPDYANDADISSPKFDGVTQPDRPERTGDR